MKAARSSEPEDFRGIVVRKLAATSIIVAAGCCLAVSAVAHQAAPKAEPARVGAAATAAAAPLAPIAARYQVTVTRRDASKRLRTLSDTWYFERTERRISLIKGDIEELWTRDAAGTIRFERVFHADQRVVDYTAGELATLGVAVSWDGLATFFDARELSALTPVKGAPRGLQRYGGKSAGRSLQIDWSSQVGLPVRLARLSPDGSKKFELIETHATAPASWPVPGARAADYLHVDSADFGDMEYDAFVRKAEAVDVVVGWRKAHAHE